MMVDGNLRVMARQSFTIQDYLMVLVNLLFKLINFWPLIECIALSSHELNTEQTIGSYIKKEKKNCVVIAIVMGI